MWSRQTWNRSHREFLIGKERETLCNVAKLNRTSGLPKKLNTLELIVQGGRGGEG